jgi:hypothetical protein
MVIRRERDERFSDVLMMTPENYRDAPFILRERDLTALI